MDILNQSALAIGQGLRGRQFSCVELMQATLKRIDEKNPAHNALVALRDADVLLAEAQSKDDELAKGIDHGFLHGLPQAIKDISAVKGMVTSLGSPILKNSVSANDSLMVERMRKSGMIIIGRSNVPEFGLGSHSYNTVYGRTRNAFDLSRTAGGSSGGAAVALAHHMLPVADGSDFMGSLRNPAGWNNVLGMRPSQGRIPIGLESAAGDQWVAQLATEGPMARNVADLAALLKVQAGYDARAPLALDDDALARLDPSALLSAQSGKSASQPMSGLRIGWLADLDAYLATEPGILASLELALKKMQAAGATVEPVKLGLSPAMIWDCWLVWRRWLVSGRVAPFFKNPTTRALMKPEAQWEATQGESLSGEQVYNASVQRTQIYQSFASLMMNYDALALPTAQIWPFDVEWTWPKQINTARGVVHMDTYHRWMECVVYATLAGLPAISVPAGFSTQALAPDVPAGLPIGMQLIGKPRGDVALLELVARYESLK